MNAPTLGHNSGDLEIEIEVRLFNSLSRYGEPRTLTLPAGATVGDVIAKAGVPRDEVFLVLRNGRDVTPGKVGDPINGERVLDHGDVVALSGPVPYSYGFGAPVV